MCVMRLMLQPRANSMTPFWNSTRVPTHAWLCFTVRTGTFVRAGIYPPGFINATVDATLKIVAPAIGSHLMARGRVVSASRLLTVCAADVFAVDNSIETLCATLLGTARNIDTRVKSRCPPITSPTPAAAR